MSPIRPTPETFLFMPHKSYKEEHATSQSAEVGLLSNARTPTALFISVYNDWGNLKSEIEKADLKLLTATLLEYGKLAEEYEDDTFVYNTCAVACDWACGTALNAAKKLLKHGAFGEWLEKETQTIGISKRTAQRYMRLAKQKTAEILIEWNPSLRQTYSACGIIPDRPKIEKSARIDSHAEAGAKLLTGITSLQVKLSRFCTTKLILDPPIISELIVARAEINRLLDDIIGGD